MYVSAHAVVQCYPFHAKLPKRPTSPAPRWPWVESGRFAHVKTVRRFLFLLSWEHARHEAGTSLRSCSRTKNARSAPMRRKPLAAIAPQHLEKVIRPARRVRPALPLSPSNRAHQLNPHQKRLDGVLRASHNEYIPSPRLSKTEGRVAKSPDGRQPMPFAVQARRLSPEVVPARALPSPACLKPVETLNMVHWRAGSFHT